MSAKAGSSIRRTKDRELYERITGCENKVSFARMEKALRSGQDVYRCTFCGHFHRATPLGVKALKAVRSASNTSEWRKARRKARRKGAAKQIVVRYPVVLKPPSARVHTATATSAVPSLPEPPSIPKLPVDTITKLNGDWFAHSVDKIAHLTGDWFTYRLEKAKRRIESGDPTKTSAAIRNLWRAHLALWFIVERQIGDRFVPFDKLGNPLHKSVTLQNGESISLEHYYTRNTGNIWSEVRRSFAS